MKKIGEYTARGIVSEGETNQGDPQRIPLFDGRFDTAYRVTGFKIWGSDFGGLDNAEVVGKLSKNDDGSTAPESFLRADDDNQVAWAGASGGVAFWATEASVIDRDNLIVEDLYVYVQTSGTGGDPVNYLVELDKYEITDWQGALTMARDRAQGDL
tara:strand:- start:709 stop:1176 length:468 start_codon:yes stop_codon:yes gene_type:complete